MTALRKQAIAAAVYRTGADWHTPRSRMSVGEEAKAYGRVQPLHDEFSGRRKLWSWAACLAVGVAFWTAFFALVLS